MHYKHVLLSKHAMICSSEPVEIAVHFELINALLPK